jgi:serine phosphatase RsbU (regulator of sigma subunit)
MDKAARQFIRWILALHLGLLLVVALIVAGAARAIHAKSREQAVQQATVTQELIAEQTARGVENYYHAVTSVLELLKPSQQEEAAATGPSISSGLSAIVPPSPPPPPFPSPTGGGPGIFNGRARSIDGALTRRRLIETLWRDVEERVALLFVVDNNPNPARFVLPPSTLASDTHMIIRDAFGDDDAPTARDVVDHLGEWLRHIDQPTVSAFQDIHGMHCNVVVVPIRGANTHRMLVAVVPIDRIEKALFSNLNARATSGAILVDDHGTIMSDTHEEVVGVNVTADARQPRISAMAARYMRAGAGGGTQEFSNTETINGTTFPPALITVEPIELKELGGKRWWIGIASRMSEVDEVVNRVFGAAVVWAIFVVSSICAILASTSIQLIRGRLRLERLQHQMLEQQLNQAREIQLNWLPRKPLSAQGIEVAAVNRPADRISGDFYNWFELPDARTCVAIGDVTGHGMSAAFLMATTQLLVRNVMGRVGNPGACLEEVNRQLCTQVFHGQFVTMLLLAIDPENQRIDIATAGHPAPLLVEDNGMRKINMEPQLVLGVDSEASYPTQRFHLPAEARLLLYTDGVLDAACAGGTRFTIDGLRKSLGGGMLREPGAILDAVVQAVDEFRGGVDLSDDLTLVAVQLRPQPAPSRLVGAQI